MSNNINLEARHVQSYNSSKNVCQQANIYRPDKRLTLQEGINAWLCKPDQKYVIRDAIALGKNVLLCFAK